MRASYPAVGSTMGINTSDCLSMLPPPSRMRFLLRRGARSCIYLCVCVRKYKPCLPTMLLRFSVSVRWLVHTCACVKRLPLAALSCLTPTHKNPISSQRGDRKGAAHTNTAGRQAGRHTHTQTHTRAPPIGRYYSEHLQSSMNPGSAKEERRLTDVWLVSNAACFL